LAQDTTVFGGQKAYENFMLLHSTTERYHWMMNKRIIL
jgi:hypothetical protein